MAKNVGKSKGRIGARGGIGTTKITHKRAARTSPYSITNNAVCGRMATGLGITNNPEKVTCKSCQKRLEEGGTR